MWCKKSWQHMHVIILRWYGFLKICVHLLLMHGAYDIGFPYCQCKLCKTTAVGPWSDVFIPNRKLYVRAWRDIYWIYQYFVYRYFCDFKYSVHSNVWGIVHQQSILQWSQTSAIIRNHSYLLKITYCVTVQFFTAHFFAKAFTTFETLLEFMPNFLWVLCRVLL